MDLGQQALPLTCTYSSSCRGCGLVSLCSLPGVALVVSVSHITGVLHVRPGLSCPAVSPDQGWVVVVVGPPTSPDAEKL
eukprot:1274524-Pyramimonas_sp.AAC.1